MKASELIVSKLQYATAMPWQELPKPIENWPIGAGPIMPDGGWHTKEESPKPIENWLANQGSITTEGLRFDAGKARFDLLPPEAMEELAMHYAKGALKYADRNWEKGMKWGRCFGSLMRHAWAFWRGEECDPETGTHHMIAVAWNAIAIYTYATRKVGEDDRFNVKG